MTWKAEVLADDNWVSNAVRFATEEEAKGYVLDLYSRWMGIRDYRTVECDDAVSYAWIGGRLITIDKAENARTALKTETDNLLEELK